MTDFNYKQRASTSEWDENYETIFGGKDSDEEGHENNERCDEESGDE